METKVYFVNRLANNSEIIKEKNIAIKWRKAEVLSDFCSPWDDKPFEKIEFRSLYDKNNIYIHFKIKDSQVYIDTTNNQKSSINNSDRVELFFKSNNTLDPYYCLEIDPSSRLMDFKARPNKQFDFNWNWPKKDIKIKSCIASSYFTVELQISIASLNKFGLIQNDEIQTGIFSVKYKQKVNNNYEPTWCSWVNPNTKTPNFHTITSFGVLKLK